MTTTPKTEKMRRALAVLEQAYAYYTPLPVSRRDLEQDTPVYETYPTAA